MNIGFIGTGSMGAMLVRAFVAAGAVQPGEVWVSNRSSGKLEALCARVPGIQVADNVTLARECRVLFLCLKPADLAAALAPLPLTGEHLLVMLASLTSFEWLESRVPSRVAKFVPAVTQEIGRGPSLLIWGPRITADDAACLRELIATISLPVIIPEHQRRTCATLASAGPALLAFILHSLAEAAVDHDPKLGPEVAHTLVREMAMATCALMSERNMSYEEVTTRVATPGGMTASGLELLAEHLPGLWKGLFRALENREESLRERLAS